MTHRVDSADLANDPIFQTGGDSTLFVRSEEGTRMEIPESRLNFFRPASFTIAKPANRKRIFVLGGSTVQGRPYETETAFPKWLELRLQAADRSQEYEVINCGGVSYASYRLAILLQEVLTYEPDAIVLYTGHNEFLEERSYDTMGDSNRWLQRFAQSSYLIRSIRKRLRPQPDARQTLSPELRTRLDLIDGLERYVRDDGWRRGVVDHFRVSLDRMIRLCRSARVPLLVCVPTSDLVATPPFKVMLPPLDADAKSRFTENWTVAQNPKASERQRLAACEACLAIDPNHAGVHYLAGQLHWNRQRATQARFHLTMARDQDVCPLRATSAIIDVILDLAETHALDLIRCDRLFDQTDSLLRPLPDGIADPQRFADHIHPTIAGHQEIAGELAKRMIDVFEINAGASYEADYQASALRHLSSLDETYYARGRQRLEGLRNWAAGRAGK